MDEILIQKAKKGDSESFVEAVLLVKDKAYRIAYSYLKNEQDSVDAICSGMEKAFRNIKKLREAKNFDAWFIRIVINEAKIQLKKKKRLVSLDEDIYLAKCQSNSVYEHEDKMDLQYILSQLDPIDRSAIYMKYYQGYTLKEIAYVLDIPIGTVKTKIYGNLKKMRTQLENEEV